MVEMLTCIKDWEAAEARLQHMVEDKELILIIVFVIIYVMRLLYCGLLCKDIELL
jgi:hypothetical protein